MHNVECQTLNLSIQNLFLNAPSIKFIIGKHLGDETSKLLTKDDFILWFSVSSKLLTEINICRFKRQLKF